MKNKLKKLVVVLGMHRSGTSTITRSLKTMNVNLGDNLMAPTKDVNDKGFWEDMDIYSLNEEMLSVLSDIWHTLLPIDSNEVKKLKRMGFLVRATNLLREKMADSLIFGVKDPRLVKLLPFWKQVFSEMELNVSYVLTLRHPLSVSQSLSKRDGFPIRKSILMWLDHMLACLTGTKGEHHILVHYDALLEHSNEVLYKMSQLLRLNLDKVELIKFQEEFLDNELRHSVFSIGDLKNDDRIPPIVFEVYKELLNCHLDTDRLNSYSFGQKMKRWEKNINSQRYAWNLINDLTLNNDQAVKNLAQRDAQLAQRDAQLAQRDAQLAQRDAQLAQRDAQLAQRDAELNSIYTSKIWRLALIVQKLRLWLMPLGSWREVAGRAVFKTLRAIKQRLFR